MSDAGRVYLGAASTATALGDSLDSLWVRLLSGESAVGELDRFSVDRLSHRLGACAGGLDAERCAGENRTQALMRRALGGFCRLPADTGVIWAGVKGDAEYVEARLAGAGDAAAGGGGAWLPCHYRAWVSAQLGLTGADGLEVNAACASSTVAIALGAAAIASGERDCVVVCASDIVSRFTHLGFAALKALSPTACRPFDTARDGLALGDGAVAILLTSGAAADGLGLRRSVEVAGWGIANDANHITGPARDGCGLVEAIGSALAQAGVSADGVSAFCAHGTGTSYNDGMELTALESVFGGRRFPLFSIKGAIGHTLGAAGGIESAVCMRALAEGRVPPTVGLRNPEGRALGRATGEIQAFSGEHILTTNSGFGGVNAALLLRRGR